MAGRASTLRWRKQNKPGSSLVAANGGLTGELRLARPDQFDLQRKHWLKFSMAAGEAGTLIL